MQIVKQVMNITSNVTGNSSVVKALGASHVSAQVTITGTNATVALQGSLDGAAFENVTTAVVVTGTSFIHKPDINTYAYYQLAVTAVNGITSIVGYIAAIGPSASSY